MIITFSPVGSCVPCFTFPNVPFPLVFPTYFKIVSKLYLNLIKDEVIHSERARSNCLNRFWLTDWEIPNLLMIFFFFLFFFFSFSSSFSLFFLIICILSGCRLRRLSSWSWTLFSSLLWWCSTLSFRLSRWCSFFFLCLRHTSY